MKTPKILGDPKRLARGHVLAWHFARDDGKLGYGDGRTIIVGETLSIGKGEKPDCCSCGMHGSMDILDALKYARGSLLCRVELWGDIDEEDGKLAARNRRVLWMVDAEVLLHEFACWCAQQALKRERKAGREPAKASWAAIEAKRAWLRGEITSEELNRAWDAARDAACAAACAAAWDAARDAARDAAWDAACASARANATAWDVQRAQLVKMLNDLEWDEAEPAEGEGGE